ncbi:MAG: 50S ribosome-binding GTPase [Fibromonadaceae bacterium]|jgi:flagellar biosynthesis protein FlhF|nr:50S ribosome-binding GTPase [Fibromonadaceae bacterium]
MIRKYRAGTFSEAFQRIKEDVGPDAVILNQQELPNSKNPNEKVEVTITLDDIAETPPPPTKTSKDTQSIGTYNHKGTKTGDLRHTIKHDKVVQDRLAIHMEDMLTEVKKLREEFAATRIDFLEGIRVVRSSIPKEFRFISEILHRNGLPAQTVQDLLAEVMLLCPVDSREETHIKEQMKKVLANRISIASRPRLRKGRPLTQMFIGPAGAGKSGVISKLAGRATMTGNTNIAIVTTDCCRMGAVEQMEAFAIAADVTLEAINSPEGVPEVFERLRDKSLVLIDTAGRSLKNEEYEEEINAFYEAIRPDEVHLVLPLNMRDRDLEKAVEVYAALKANRIIFTKQDESCEPGALLWLPLKFEIPLSYIGNGQGPDNIVSAEKEIIAEWLLK